MLPLPRLDDESFEEIFSDAKRQIPELTSEWTDFNYHDPGITMLQLLAWLKEMQQFYIDGIGDIHRMKYLKLLNYIPRKLERARVDISMEGVKSDTVLPSGTKFDAQGVIFETEERVCIPEASIHCIMSLQKGKWVDITRVLKDGAGIAEYIFGEKPVAGNELYIGFKKGLPVDMSLLMHVQLFEKKGIIRNRIDDEDIYPMAVTKWEYWSGGKWQNIEILRDETFGFIKDGYIEFSLHNCMEFSRHGGLTDELCWIRCILDCCNYDLSPKLEDLSMCTFKVAQRDTKIEIKHFDGNGEENQVFSIDSFLALSGKPEVQVLLEEGLWMPWESFHIDKGKNWWDRNLILTSDENGRIPPAGTENIRVIFKSADLMDRNILAGSTGYPEQQYEISFNGVLYSSFELQVGIHKHGKLLWQDWKKTEDILKEGYNSLCYQLDTKSGSVLFGDGENGAIPSIGTENIRIISCAETRGLGGNVKDGSINKICLMNADMEEIFSDVRIKNEKYAEGGRDQESIDEALQRFRRDFGKASRAITLEDYENIAAGTPGLIIRKVRAIPAYRPDTGYLGPLEDSNCVTVVVKAYSDQNFKPSLNDAYLQNIRRHLDKYRLVSTEVHVIPPRYIGIHVFCALEIKSYYKDAKEILRNFFETELNAVNGKRDFGQNVEYGDIYGKIESIDCVKRITALSLDARGANVIKKYGGDIEIPPDGLTYLEAFDLEIKE